MTEHTAAGARIDLVGVVQQLERALSDELDYRIEARNAATFRRTLAEFPRILVPRVIESYTTERVLTTERIRGVKIDAVSPLARLEHDFHPVAAELTRAYLKQITIDGHFHADPHPGNLFIVLPHDDNPPTPSEARDADRRAVHRAASTPLARIESDAQRHAAPQPDDVDVKLSLIDFGMTARLSNESARARRATLARSGRQSGRGRGRNADRSRDRAAGFRPVALRARGRGIDGAQLRSVDRRAPGRNGAV